MMLIIGYGSPLRGDDTIGHHVAHLLDRRQIRGDIQTITPYQLTPELVEPISHAQRVIFIDARIGENPGEIMLETVQPHDSTASFTHHVTPASLLAAAHALYGVSPEAVIFSVTGGDFGYGERLSPEVAAAVPALLMAVEELIQQYTEHQAEWSITAGTATQS